jgi:hypothetical protein
MASPPREYLRCHACRRPTRADLIDAKDDGSGDFTVLHCRACYGDGWSPMVAAWAQVTDPPHYQQEATDDDGADDDGAGMFLNYYHCDRCGHDWTDAWPAMCDDDCPACGARHWSPYKSEDI